MNFNILTDNRSIHIFDEKLDLLEDTFFMEETGITKYILIIHRKDKTWTDETHFSFPSVYAIKKSLDMIMLYDALIYFDCDEIEKIPPQNTKMIDIKILLKEVILKWKYFKISQE